MHYHMKRHEGKLPYECTLCNKQFLHANTLNLHKKIHNHEEQDREFKCPSKDCEFKGALTKANLLIHYVRKHCTNEVKSLLDSSKDSVFGCKSCKKEMKSLTAFHYHTVKCMKGLGEDRLNHIKTIQQ